MAVLTGFEPATSGLTGRRALQTAPQDQAVPAGAGPSFVPPPLWEWNRSLGVCNSVWAWLEGVENVRPSLEPALTRSALTWYGTKFQETDTRIVIISLNPFIVRSNDNIVTLNQKFSHTRAMFVLFNCEDFRICFIDLNKKE